MADDGHEINRFIITLGLNIFDVLLLDKIFLFSIFWFLFSSKVRNFQQLSFCENIVDNNNDYYYGNNNNNNIGTQCGPDEDTDVGLSLWSTCKRRRPFRDNTLSLP